MGIDATMVINIHKPSGRMGPPQWLSSKESSCNAGDAGDAGSIPELGNPLEEGMETHFSILAWRILGQRSLVGCGPWGRKKSWT